MYLQVLSVFVLGRFICGNADVKLTYKIDSIKETSIQISWNPPQNYLMDDIMKYNVYAYAHGKVTWKSFKQPQFNTTHVFEDLEPFTKYQINIVVSHKDAAETIVVAAMEAVTLPSVGQPVTNLHLTLAGFEDLRLEWTAPDKPNGEIECYEVKYVNQKTLRENTVEIATTGTQLVNLDSSTTYNISIRTRNKQANGHGGGLGDAVEGLFRTRAGVKLTYKIDNINETSIQISWNPPQNYLLDDITKYNVYAFAHGKVTGKSFKQPKFKTTHVFEDLKPFTKYQINIVVSHKDAAENIRTAVMEAVTLPSVGQPVTNLHFTHIGFEDVSLEWMALDEPNGEIECYEVKYVNQKTLRENTVEVSTTGTQLVSLDSSTPYNISIRTRNKQANGNGGGFGDRVEGLFRTLAGDDIVSDKVLSAQMAFVAPLNLRGPTAKAASSQTLPTTPPTSDDATIASIPWPPTPS